MNIGSRLENALKTFKYFARTSTIHGLLHTFQSTGTLRPKIWCILAFLVFFIGLYHLIITTQKYMDSPVTSELKFLKKGTSFPYITMCSLKPVCEVLYHNKQFVNYLDKYWKNFAAWITNEHLKYFTDAASQENYEIFRQRLDQVLQVMWVSGDTRDIAIQDTTMLLDCKFNSVECNDTHFTLIQNYQFWNCYTFESERMKNAHPYMGKGHNLDMALYTGTYDNTHTNLDITEVYDNSKCLHFLRNPELMKNPMKCISNFCPNQIMQNKGYQNSGIRVFVHQHQEFPLSSKDFIDIKTGRSSTITLNPLYRKFLPRSSQKCHDTHYETVEYIKYFGVDLNDTANGEYLKTENEFVYEEKQNIVFNKCKCYSHRYPYSSSIRSQLCYYTPLEQWKSPTEVILRNIQCHDEAVEDANSRTSELMQKHHDKIMCEQMRYRPTILSLPWPKFEYVMNIWEDLFVPKKKKTMELTELDKKVHHIYNKTRNKKQPSREEILFNVISLSNRECAILIIKNAALHKSNNKLTLLDENLGGCVEQKSMARNMAQVRIKMQTDFTEVFEETPSYDWTEAVSEIGGTFGLWIGVSLMVIFELLELFIVVIISFITNERLGGEPEVTVLVANNSD